MHGVDAAAQDGASDRAVNRSGASRSGGLQTAEQVIAAKPPHFKMRRWEPPLRTAVC